MASKEDDGVDPTEAARLSPTKWWALLLFLTLFTMGRVATTLRVFSPTADEPWHVIAGYDVLTRGTFTTDTQHPPLARVFFGAPFLAVPGPPGENAPERGSSLLAHDGRVEANIARARAGNLLFLGLSIIAVALWARHLLSPAAGLLAAVLMASLPAVLGHGGLATTDMAVAPFLTLALYVLSLFLERETWKRTLLLGLTVAAGLLTKYSFLVFFPAAALALLVVRRRFPGPRILLSAAIAFALVWASYGFSFGTLADADARGPGFTQEVFSSERLASIPIPAPHFVIGVLEVKHHDNIGHRAFLFNSTSMKGWWYYFPLALFYKTPIPFLVLALAGCALMLARRRAAEIAAIGASVLAVAMTSHINIGIRHLLPIYAPLSIAAAFCVLELRRYRLLVTVTLSWLLISGAMAHPDYLPWFNAFAGSHPERVLNDSNLDWGQDAFRLARHARDARIPRLTIALFPTPAPANVGLPPFEYLEAGTTPRGWVAMSEYSLRAAHSHSPELSAWVDQWFPEDRPYRRIGKSIRLYQFN